MAKGTVKWFDPKKGFGFVVSDNETDVFVHYSKINKEGFRCLRTGQVVEYREVVGDKGLQGVEVVIVADNRDDRVGTEAFADNGS